MQIGCSRLCDHTCLPPGFCAIVLLSLGVERLTQEMPGQVMLVAWLHSGIVCIWPLGCNEPCCKPRLVQLVATLLGAMAVLGENVGAVTASRASKLSWCQLCVCQLLCQAVAQVPLWVPVVCKITRCRFWNPVMANTHKHIERESRERGRESAQAINTLQQQCLFFCFCLCGWCSGALHGATC